MLENKINKYIHICLVIAGSNSDVKKNKARVRRDVLTRGDVF